MALLISPGHSSAFPFSSNGIMIDQDDYREAKSSQVEDDMQVEREKTSDIMPIK